MKKRTTLLLGTVLMALFLGSTTVAVNAQMHGPGGPGEHPVDPGREPECGMDENGTVTIDTDIITISANGKFPSFHFWFTADENGTISKFMLAYMSIVEFEDANGDNAFQENETLNFAPLAAYEWVLQSGSVEEGGMTTEVWLKYTKSGLRAQGPLSGFEPAMDGPGSAHEFEDMSLQIFAHIYLQDYYGNVTDDHGVKANYTVAGGSELKMDIQIGNFPFSTNTSSVAIQTILKENVANGDQLQNRHRYMTREQTRNMTGNSSNIDPNLIQNEELFQNRLENHTQQIEFVNTETSLAEGFFSWLDTAVITWPGGVTEAVDVTASYIPTMNGLALYLAYPNFDDGTLLHDPSIGLIEESAPTETESLTGLILVAGIGVVALVLVAIAAIRRR